MAPRDVINVTQYLDYRTFLVAHVQEQKRRNPRWTFGAWAKRLGLKGTASITRIIHGAREPGPEMVENLVRYFSFNEKEAEYFRDLVRLHKIKRDARLKLLLMEKMGKKYPNGAVRILDEKTFNTISNWYYLSIREMVRLKRFVSDPNWISKAMVFKVSQREAAQALRTLVEIGLLEYGAEGKLRVAAGRLNTSDDIASEAIKRYHEEMLDNAKAALRNTKVETREITAQMIAMKASSVEQAKELIREFQNKFSELLEHDDADVVYQMQIQFFPLTKEVG